jgi:histidinol-phosphate aminotransferase
MLQQARGLRFTALVRDLPDTVPFVGPEAQERARGRPFRARVGANESVFGPSPKAIAAMHQAAADAWMYCDPEYHDLKVALAHYHGVRPENIVVGEGIDGLLGLAVRLVIEPGDVVVTSLGAYPTFNYHVAGFGGRLVRVPYVHDHEDPDALLDAARREDARLIYFANPDNPMGSWWNAADVQSLIERVPARTLLLLDEAYSDTAPPETVPPLDVSNPQVLRLRTFSKAYGLAGLRVGYGIGETALIKSFDKIRNHFGVNRLGQIAALAALADQHYLTMAVRKIAEARHRIGAIAAANGLKALPSATNFVAIDCGRDGHFAKRVLDELVARDVFVRMPSVRPLDRCIRVSAGRAGDLDLLAEALPQALRAAA